MTSELGAGAIIGSYRIESEIGRGGMGSVYSACHALLPRRAAIKLMHVELRRFPSMASRMVQEAAIVEQIDHPGMVRIFECGVLDDDRVWMAMELVEGETLATKLERVGTLPPHEVASLLANVADVLASVHELAVTHRDLKPDNVILTPTARAYPLRLIDFGVAHIGREHRLTLEGATPGTPLYMAPEQAMGKNIGPPCDIYALGVIAYEALSGRPPFDGRTLAEVVSHHLLSEPTPLAELCGAPRSVLCRMIHRMLAKDPAARPSAVEVRELARVIMLELADADADEYEYEEYVVALPDTERDAPMICKPRWTPQINSQPHGVIVTGELAARSRS